MPRPQLGALLRDKAMILEFDPSVPEITATAAVSSRNAKPFDAIELDLAVLWMDAAR